MIQLPNLSPEKCVQYMQLKWKLDVVEMYLGMTCGLYGCKVTSNICPTCKSMLEKKYSLMNQIFTLADDKTYLESMDKNFTHLMEKLSILNRDNPDLLQDLGVHPIIVDKRKRDLVEKFKYMDMNFIYINNLVGKIYDKPTEAEQRLVQPDKNPLGRDN